jgi:hypothetical protein
MNRNRRLAYLAEMGIETWVPTQALSGAAQGHWIAPASLNPSGSISANSSANISSGSPAASPQQSQKVIVNRGLAIAEVLDLGGDVKTSSQQQPQAQSAPVSNTAANAEEVNTATNKQTSTATVLTQSSATVAVYTQSDSLEQFTLASSVCGNLLLVDDISAMSFASSAYQNWINAILLSLGKLPGDKPLMSTAASQLDRFEWPLADSGLFDSTEQAAKDIVSAWLLRKLQENQVSWVLLMGKASIATLANTQDGDHDANHGKQLGAIAALPGSSSVQALLTHGSAELWAQPLLKRDFWQHLQAVTTRSE